MVAEWMRDDHLELLVTAVAFHVLMCMRRLFSFPVSAGQAPKAISGFCLVLRQGLFGPS